MIRLTALYLFVAGLMLLSIRRWFLALCGLLFLTVIMQHPSMPREIAGFQGLNPWNAAFLFIFIMWLVNRRTDPPRAGTSIHAGIVFVSFVTILVLAGLVAVTDARAIKSDMGVQLSIKDVLIETIVNPLKFLIVGLMFYDGATTRGRIRQALFAAVSSGMVYAALMYKTMKLGVFTMDFSAARRATDKLIGLYANDMAEVLAFSMWGAVFLVFLIHRNVLRIPWLVATAAIVPAFLSLKSRAGFLAFALTGMALGALRWRKILLALPITVLLVVLFAPDVVDRVMTGVSSEGPVEHDWDAISAGRTTYLWPAALAQIGQSPIVGHGRLAILRTGSFDTILDALGRVPAHPHSSYLEILLDAGAVGLIVCLACIVGIFRASWRLLRERNDPLMTTIGAVGVIAIVTELSAGVAGSSFYPSQSAVPYLCVWGVAVRVAREKAVWAEAAGRIAVVAAAPPTIDLEPVAPQGDSRPCPG